jgi:hypothetical protein
VAARVFKCTLADTVGRHIEAKNMAQIESQSVVGVETGFCQVALSPSSLSCHSIQMQEAFAAVIFLQLGRHSTKPLGFGR